MTPLREMPLVRIEIEQMKHTIMSYLSDYSGQLSDLVESEIEAALDNIDLADYVRPAVDEAIQKAVQAYFGYGDGWEIIRAAVAGAFGDSEAMP